MARGLPSACERGIGVTALAWLVWLACLGCSSDGGTEAGSGAAGGHGGSDQSAGGNGARAGANAGDGSAGGAGERGEAGRAGNTASACGPRSEAPDACWDGHREGCLACYAPDEARAPCMGVGGQAAPVVPPRPMCSEDNDCLSVSDVCEPSRPEADASGCRKRDCTSDADCVQGVVCDPDGSREITALERAVLQSACGIQGCKPGCRIQRCDEAGALPCEQGVCEPAAMDASALNGCRPLHCAAGEACGAGYACNAQGACAPIHCSEPDGFACPAGQRCNPESPNAPGCETIHCNEPGGFVCEGRTRCDERVTTGHGCVLVHCRDPGAPACDEGLVCNPDLTRDGGCAQCASNDDCGCGYCITGRCYNEPGVCERGCA